MSSAPYQFVFPIYATSSAKLFWMIKRISFRCEIVVIYIGTHKNNYLFTNGMQNVDIVQLEWKGCIQIIIIKTSVGCP